MARDVTLVLKSDSEDGTSAVEWWLTSPKRGHEGVLQILRGSLGLWSPESRCDE